MKILIIDPTGVCLDFAIRCKAYGHQVKAFIRNNKDGSRCEVGVGLIDRIPHWEDHMNWADLIFCTDNTFYIHPLERFRDQGYPIFGPSIDTNKWEQDREHGSEILSKCGINELPNHKFSNYDDAINFVKKTNRRYVSKPLGDGDKALSYVGKSPKDLEFMLGYWKKCNAYKGEFILQEFCKGIEMAVGGWFGLNGFSKNVCENWEFKKLFNGDLGPATGEMGTILRYTEESKLADEVLCPLSDYLSALGYTGYIDVNCIIDEKGTPWPLEFTMRPGWPLFEIQQSLHKGDPSEWMLDLIDGKDTLKVSNDVACGISIAMSDFPHGNKTKKENTGFPLFGITQEDVVNNIHLNEVKLGEFDKKPILVTTGEYVCVVSGTGKTIKDATDKTYETAENKIKIPNSPFYRTDIGGRLEEQIPTLHTLGYSKTLKYNG